MGTKTVTLISVALASWTSQSSASKKLAGRQRIPPSLVDTSGLFGKACLDFTLVSK